ncbi:helix-turn-helix domain-containing protein [Sporosarcina cascadiensis]|uniref:helix-turn-helix domain-containing protein n=1 Tax=Sporosarcina cascadiensis TaxID=2660747 RepID=UPI00129AB292|nr:helix-turn-helix transcriptional regulator [Sporosarcina cascadiensis]
MDVKLVGERIKERRLELGLTMQEIADKINVNKSTIQRYESGKISDIKTPIIESIANFLDVSPLWILGRTEIKVHSERYEKATHLMNLNYRSVMNWSEDQAFSEVDTVIIREHFHDFLSHYKKIIEKLANAQYRWRSSEETYFKLYKDRLTEEEIRELFLKNEIERELDAASEWIKALPSWIARNESSK